MIETIKKIGAGFIIIVLAGMMALMFSNQPIDEITKILAGTPGAGKFKDEVIDIQTYAMIQGNCRQNFLQQFGTAPEGMVNSCTTSNLKQLYAIPSFARSVSLEVSDQFIESEALKRAERQYRKQQAAGSSPDDILSIAEIYQREQSYFPANIQKRSAIIEMAQEVLGAKFEASVEEAGMKDTLSKIRLKLNVLHYGSTELEEQAEKGLTISEDQVRTAYEEEQKKLPADRRKPFSEERNFVKSRLENENKQSAVAALKKQLGNLRAGFSLKEVEAITGIRAASAGFVALDKLRDLKTGSGRVNLIQSDILQFLAQGKLSAGGPFQSGEQTIYLEVIEIDASASPDAKSNLAARESDQGRVFFNYLIDTEAELGKFAVYAPK